MMVYMCIKVAIAYLSWYNGHGFQITFVLDDMLTASKGTVGPGHFVFTTLSQLCFGKQ